MNPIEAYAIVFAPSGGIDSGYTRDELWIYHTRADAAKAKRHLRSLFDMKNHRVVRVEIREAPRKARAAR